MVLAIVSFHRLDAQRVTACNLLQIGRTLPGPACASWSGQNLAILVRTSEHLAVLRH
jgi:hypothetical protein